MHKRLSIYMHGIRKTRSACILYSKISVEIDLGHSNALDRRYRIFLHILLDNLGMLACKTTYSRNVVYVLEVYITDSTLHCIRCCNSLGNSYSFSPPFSPWQWQSCSLLLLLNALFLFLSTLSSSSKPTHCVVAPHFHPCLHLQDLRRLPSLCRHRPEDFLFVFYCSFFLPLAQLDSNTLDTRWRRQFGTPMDSR